MVKTQTVKTVTTPPTPTDRLADAQAEIDAAQRLIAEVEEVGEIIRADLASVEQQKESLSLPALKGARDAQRHLEELAREKANLEVRLEASITAGRQAEARLAKAKESLERPRKLVAAIDAGERAQRILATDKAIDAALRALAQAYAARDEAIEDLAKEISRRGSCQSVDRFISDSLGPLRSPDFLARTLWQCPTLCQAFNVMLPGEGALNLEQLDRSLLEHLIRTGERAAGGDSVS
jgi:hypothetical protein